MNSNTDSERGQVAQLSPPDEKHAWFTYSTGDRPLDGYTIKRGIGSGGFGEVYYAVSDGGKEVALKQIQRHLDVELRGVSQCLNLKHPNLVVLYDVKQSDRGENWVVMEFVAGENLGDLIAKYPKGMAETDVLALLRGICDGVGYLHEHGIVHRDLKPGNIFIENNQVKIGDYGLAKFISASRRSGQTESVGTVHYMAPELAHGKYGKEIDLYAIGVIVYEMLTGYVPFRGQSPGEILMKHLTAAPDLNVLAEPFRSVVARLLAKNPEHRYPTAQSLVADLEVRVAGTVPPGLDAAEMFAGGAGGSSPPPPPPPPPGAAGPAAAGQRGQAGAAGQVRSVRFTIDSVHGGFSTAEGLLRFTGDALVFDLQTKTLGMINSAIREVRVGLGAIESIELQDGWFAPSIVLRALRPAAFEDIPTSALGQGTLRVVRTDREAATGLVHAVTAALAARDPNRAAAGWGPSPGFAGAEPGQYQAWQGAGPEAAAATRRLVRPIDDRVIKGVCSGLARYFAIEPVAMRLLLVLLAFFTAIFPCVIAYILLALSIPSEGSPSAAGPRVRPYRLMRSTDDRVWAGVCGGWALYFGIEPVLIRVLYALGTFFTGILPGFALYILMIFIMPRADAGVVPGAYQMPGGSPVVVGPLGFGQVFGRLLISAIVGAGIGGLTGGTLAGTNAIRNDAVAALVGVGSGMLTCGLLLTGMCRSLAAPHRLWPALASIFLGVGSGMLIGGLSEWSRIGGTYHHEEFAVFSGVGGGLMTAAMTGFLLFTSLGTPLRWRWFFVVVMLAVGTGMVTGGSSAALGVKEEVAALTGVGVGFLAAGILSSLLIFGNLANWLSPSAGATALGAHGDGAANLNQTMTYYGQTTSHAIPTITGGTTLLLIAAGAAAAGLGALWMTGIVPPAVSVRVIPSRPIVVDSEIHRFTGHRGRVTALAFNRAGTQLVSGGEDHTVRLWDMTARAEIRQFSGHNRGINAVAFSPDGSKVAAAADCKDVRIWNAETGGEIAKSLDHPGEVYAVAFNHEGTQIVTGSTDDIVRLIDASTGQQILQFFGCKASIHAVAFSPDGATVAAIGNFDSVVRIWDAATGRPVRTFGMDRSVWHRAIAYSPDGQLLAVSTTHGSVHVWNIATGRETRWTEGSSLDNHSLAFGPDSTQILSGGDFNGFDLRDARTGNGIARFESKFIQVTAHAFGPDGSLTASGNSDGTIRLWDVPESVRKQREIVGNKDSEHSDKQTTSESNSPELTIPVHGESQKTDGTTSDTSKSDNDNPED